jgi:hypothetical protein
MKGSALRNLAAFKQIRGENFYQNVLLGTSCWSLITYDNAEARERELKSHPKFWKPMITCGSKVDRLPSTVETARTLIAEVANHAAVALQVQTETVDQGMSFHQLAAARVLSEDLERLQREQAMEKERLRLEQRKAEEAQCQRHLELRQESERKARQARIQHHLDVKKYCKHISPVATCDRCKSRS